MTLVDTEILVEYIEKCVSENYDINETPTKFDSIEDLVETYLDQHIEDGLLNEQFDEVVRECVKNPEIMRLVK